MGILELEKEIIREEAFEKGIKKERTAVVKNLLLKTNHTIQDIADIAEVSLDFVLEVKKTLPSA